MPTPGSTIVPTVDPPSHPAVPPTTVVVVLAKLTASCAPEILPSTMSLTSNDVSTAVVTTAVIALPFSNLAALLIAAPPVSVVPLLKAFASAA